MAEMAKKITLLVAIHILSHSWKLAKPKTISNCYKKAFNQERDEDVIGDVPTRRLRPCKRTLLISSTERQKIIISSQIFFVFGEERVKKIFQYIKRH